MLTDDEKIAIVNKLYEHSAAGDFDTCETMLTEDFFITEAEDRRWRVPIRVSPHCVTSMPRYSEWWKSRESRGWASPPAATMWSPSFISSLPTAEPAHLCEMFRFRDGKVCEIKPYYFDAAPMRAAHEAFKAKQAG